MTDKYPNDFTKASFIQQLNNNNNNNNSSSSSNVHTDAMYEELRCQYSSKRCLNERTHKKSGGLHKFCAMHREKANRNQMRLDQRRRVLKQQQKEQQRQHHAQQLQHIQAQHQMQWYHSHPPAAMAVGQNFFDDNKMQCSPASAMCTPVSSKLMSPPNMTISMCMPMQICQTMQPQQPQQPLFDQHDLDILEAMLFSSDEEQSDATPIAYCRTPRFFHSPIVNV